MRMVGRALMAVGILASLYALKMGALDIGSGAPEASGAIASNDYYPHLIGACVVTVLGAVLSVLAQQRQDDEENLDRLVELSLYRPKERDLTNPTYRSWLSAKYQVWQRPETGVFVLNGRTYPSLDDAMLAAHDFDVENGG